MTTFLAILFGTITGLMIGVGILIIERRKFRRNMPDENKKKELINKLVELKKSGLGYSERLKFLKDIGLRNDVSNVFLGEAERVSSR